MKILSCEQMRRLEQSAVDSGIGYYELMKNAGTAAAKAFVEQFDIRSDDRAVSICGKGNNGGDGIVAAVYLNSIGIRTDIILVDGEIKTPEASKAISEASRANIPIWRIWEETEKSIEKIKAADYIIDAIYGIGFKGGLRENIMPVVELINRSRGKVMSMDLPSGAECDSGQVNNLCVNADLTVSFTTLKPVHVLYPSMDFCGMTGVMNVGIPHRLVERSSYWLETTSRANARAVLKKRKVSSNKGTFGTLLAVCGSYGMAGAALLAVRGAYTCGVGLVKAAVTRAVYALNSPVFPEAVYLPLIENKGGRISGENIKTIIEQANKSSAVLIGCGLGVDDDTTRLVKELILRCEVPLVLDADALNIVAESPEILKHAQCDIIITPHPGEMARLCGISVQQVQQNRKSCAQFFAEKYNVITVLKGAYTIIASPSGKCIVNTTGNPGMARGGSGDVLAGMISGLLAQGHKAFDCACAGVYIHGGAGDICREKLGEYSMLATDIIAAVPEFLKNIL
ncbi:MULTISPECIES: NAD(P)H-hydrate dehydratase [unclassified Ruminococcus]|uniref:NAD(P)H-hydrate dehydratase n=1 Tax=unclassified Ruminococcus TaxID=2608920 RepID=UPI00210A8380|nr:MULTISPECIES: NAD(P)H-hydrate dehydratase [unclassified Ruminococcus]MCQ4021594.1 NAD(P)H-hydrate dehydratase [Ruminococcus sp. zg-924]MCQ4114039.1 NAD(P)H-hydrate dehydratase [Ruminococcus sp. zg-921]